MHKFNLFSTDADLMMEGTSARVVITIEYPDTLNVLFSSDPTTADLDEAVRRLSNRFGQGHDVIFRSADWKYLYSH